MHISNVRTHVRIQCTYLVGRGLDLRGCKEFGELSYSEVAHTNALREPSSLDLLHLRPGRRNVRLRKARVMDQVEVYILDAEL